VSVGEPIVLSGHVELDEIAAASEPARSEVDAQFLESLREGDAAAFDRLVGTYANGIYALLHRLVDDAEEARDLTQETFLQAFRSIAAFRGEASLRTWLYRIAVNQARNRRRWWRRRCRDETISLDEPSGNGVPVAEGDPEQTALQRERERALHAALQALGEPFREVVVLRDIEGLSYEEIAATLEISLGTVKSRLARGRAELRRRLESSFT